MKSVASLAWALRFAALIVSSSSGLMAQSPADWTALFNGTDLRGWTIAPAPTPAHWKVDDGTLVGGEGSGRGSLLSDEQFRDFELELEFMLAEHGTRCSADVIGPEQVNASAEKRSREKPHSFPSAFSLLPCQRHFSASSSL